MVISKIFQRFRILAFDFQKFLGELVFSVRNSCVLRSFSVRFSFNLLSFSVRKPFNLLSFYERFTFVFRSYFVHSSFIRLSQNYLTNLK